MILVDTHPGYRQITLNRPDRLNALQPEMADAIIAAFDDAQADESCRAVLLTGAKPASGTAHQQRAAAFVLFGFIKRAA